MTRFKLINCERENERAELMAVIAVGIAQRESEPWDWADYEALRILAAKRHIETEDKEPIKWALERCEAGLENDQWRAFVAEELRRIAEGQQQ